MAAAAPTVPEEYSKARDLAKPIHVPLAEKAPGVVIWASYSLTKSKGSIADATLETSGWLYTFFTFA